MSEEATDDRVAALEAELRQRFDAGDFTGTVAAAITGYGDELFGFLVGLSRDPAHADDVFGTTCERMWKGLPTFRWDSSFRVWAYAIARNEFLASTRQITRQRLQVPISEMPIQEAIARVRSTTPVYQKADVKDRFAKVRETLDPDDHMLLGLRIDRQMAWNDIATVLGAADDAAVKREAAALRKRFERLKARLRELLDA